MEFKRGDRVRMLKHADWKDEAVGTIISLYSRPVTLHDGSPDLLYAIEFDEPQRDFTDEMNGMGLQYKSSDVLGRFLRPFGEAV
jgi:hypothetical protein